MDIDDGLGYRTYWHRSRESDRTATLAMVSMASAEEQPCLYSGMQPYAFWRYASARKFLCRDAKGGNLVVERYANGLAKLIRFEDSFVRSDESFAADLREMLEQRAGKTWPY